MRDGPFEVLEVDSSTVVLRMGSNDKSVSRDWIVEAPVPGQLDKRAT